MKRTPMTGWVLGVLLGATAAAWGQAAGDNADLFKDRMKLDQKATRVVKVRADRAAVPFGNATLSALLNSRTVGGAAAQATFNLAPERYNSIIQVRAEVEPGGDDALMVRLDLHIRGDRHIDDATFDRFALALKDQLVRELRTALDEEKEAVQRHRAQVLARRQDLAAQLEDLRQQRLQLTESQGLAAESQTLVQGLMADLVSRQQSIESGLAAKTARKDFLRARVTGASKPDAVDVSLKNLVEARTRQVQALAKSKAKPDEVAAAEALLAEAEVRQATNQRDLENGSAARQVEKLEADIADLEAQKQFTQQKLADVESRSGERYRAGELALALQTQEQALTQRIADLDKQGDALTDRADKLVISGASVLGIPGEERGKSRVSVE